MIVTATHEAAQSDELEKACFVLRLYVAGSTGRSMRAIRNLTRFVDQFLPGQTDVEIIDVCQQQCAMADNVFAVPALIRHRPAPSLVLLGDLSDAERLKRAFGADLDG